MCVTPESNSELILSCIVITYVLINCNTGDMWTVYPRANNVCLRRCPQIIPIKLKP